MTSDPWHVSLADSLRGIRRYAGYPTVEALALALEIDPMRILRFEAANLKPDEPGIRRWSTATASWHSNDHQTAHPHIGSIHSRMSFRMALGSHPRLYAQDKRC